MITYIIFSPLYKITKIKQKCDREWLENKASISVTKTLKGNCCKFNPLVCVFC